MKFKEVLFIIISIIIVNSISMKSQIVICNECPETSWQPTIPPYPVMQFLIVGTMVQVSYQTRICNGIYEVKVLSITVSNLQQTFTLEEIYGMVLSELIRQNQMGFPPIGNNQSNIWRIIQGACWQYGNIGHTIILPCNEECCITTVYVMISCGHKYFELVKEMGIPKCPIHGTYQNSDCVYICNSLRQPIKPIEMN